MGSGIIGFFITWWITIETQSVFYLSLATYLTILQTAVPSDKIGRVMSIDHTVSMAIAPIGALIVGPLADLKGVVNFLYSIRGMYI